MNVVIRMRNVQRINAMFRLRFRHNGHIGHAKIPNEIEMSRKTEIRQQVFYLRGLVLVVILNVAF